MTLGRWPLSNFCSRGTPSSPNADRWPFGHFGQTAMSKVCVSSDRIECLTGWDWDLGCGDRCCGFGVRRLGLWASGFGFRVWVLGSEVWDLVFGAWGLGSQVLGVGIGVPGCGVWDLAFRVQGLGFRVVVEGAG